MLLEDEKEKKGADVAEQQAVPEKAPRGRRPAAKNAPDGRKTGEGAGRDMLLSIIQQLFQNRKRFFSLCTASIAKHRHFKKFFKYTYKRFRLCLYYVNTMSTDILNQ